MRAILQKLRDFRSGPKASDGEPETVPEDAHEFGLETGEDFGAQLSEPALSAKEPDASRSPWPSSERKKASIASLRLFVPLIAVWGAALGALSVLVLPISLIQRIAATIGLSSLGAGAAYVFAATAALIFGTVAALAAIAFRRRELGFEKAAASSFAKSRDIEPIDPSEELGSESLDAPLETEPFLVSEIEDEFEPEWFEDAESTGGAHEDEEDMLLLVDDQVPGSADDNDGFDDPAMPRELDLAEFAATPGRDGVWVEETADYTGDDEAPQALSESPQPETVGTLPLAAQIAPSAPTALEKLRQAPVHELSLVHMVERFAAALHDHQDAERKRPGSQRMRQNDAALAEALRALTLFNQDGFDADSEFASANADALRDTTRELRAALGKLQDLRGAA